MKRRTFAVLIGAAASLVVGTWLWDRHQFNVVWPTKVQSELFGETLVSSDDLVWSERHFAYGQGFARWKYKVANGNPSLQHLCGTVSITKCILRRHRTVEQDVDIFASLSGSVLTLEEAWS